MDELRGPNIQIVLHVKEGLGFGFLRSPFIVSGSLNGYMLETDPAVPCHAPVFDAELVWEADKRRFRSLRVQNVPIKVEVYTTGTQGRKDKVGYLLLSLLGAQPCPSNKIVEIKHTWHRLLGVKTEGKCCHPQLLMSLSIEDRVSALTPRNELRMFHSNEVAYPSTYFGTNPPTARSLQMTVQEYLAESKKTVSSPALRPRLLVDEGLIQLGGGRQLFVLSLVIGSMENLDQFLPNNDPVECYITYSIFTHNVMTDRVSYTPRTSGSNSLHFNQRTSLRLRGSLPDLTRYLAECPHLVAKLCAGERDVAICSLDLRKLIPTEDIEQFVGAFCDSEGAVQIHERAFPLRCGEPPGPPPSGPGRRPYLDFEMTFRFLGEQKEVPKPNNLTARSVTQLESERRPSQLEEIALDCKSGSCTQLDGDLGGVAYTNIGGCNTDRYKTASGDAVLQTGELTDLIKKMYETFTISQEALTRRIRTSDANVQCDDGGKASGDGQREKLEREKPQESGDGEPKLDSSKSDTCINASKNFMDMPKHADLVALALSSMDRSTIMQKFVDELEDWKERQQQLYNAQLKRKEEYHLEQLSLEWSRRRDELERRLAAGLERCRLLANDLRNATDDFRLRGYRNTEREKKLLDAKKALESHYTAKYQELREASQKMEADSEHQLRLKDMRVEELEAKVEQLEKQVHGLKNNIKDTEKEAENKYSGLTKGQTASLIQELRCLEEKLSHAQQSKAFFKEQWGRAVRELHLAKLAARRHALTSLRVQRRQLGDLGPGSEEEPPSQPKLKDDYYDVFAHDPLNTRSIISSGNLDGIDVYEDLKLNMKNPASDKLTELISQRDALIEQDSPDEGALRSLNHEIRSMLLNCAT